MKSPGKRIFIAGAARPAGISLLKRLKKENVEVTSLVNNWRERLNIWLLSDRSVCAPLFEVEKWQQHVEGHDILIYCHYNFTGKDNNAGTIDLTDELFYKFVNIQQAMKVQTFLYVTGTVKPDERFSFLDTD